MTDAVNYIFSLLAERNSRFPRPGVRPLQPTRALTRMAGVFSSDDDSSVVAVTVFSCTAAVFKAPWAFTPLFLTAPPLFEDSAASIAVISELKGKLALLLSCFDHRLPFAFNHDGHIQVAGRHLLLRTY